MFTCHKLHFVISIKRYIYVIPYLSSSSWYIHLALVIYVLRTCHDHLLELFMIYVLRTCDDHSILIHSCDLCAANMPWLLVWMLYRFDVMFILAIYVLRTCRNYLFEYFIRFYTLSCNLCAANMPWLLVWTFYSLSYSFLQFMCCEYAVITCLIVYRFDIKMWLKYTLPWKL